MVPSFQPFTTNEDWESYCLHVYQHFKAYNVESEDQKRAFFLCWVGSDVFIQLQKLFGCSDIGSKPYKKFIKQLNYVKNSCVSISLKFLRIVMDPGQSYADWTRELRAVARLCTKPDCNQSLVDNYTRDAIVLHTPHNFVRTQALQMMFFKLFLCLKLLKLQNR